MFALLLDESTDISKKAVVLVFVRFIWDFQLYEDLLFSYELIHTMPLISSFPNMVVAAKNVLGLQVLVLCLAIKQDCWVS